MNSGEIVANSLVDYLRRHPEIEGKLSKAALADGSTMLTMTARAAGNIEFLVTDISEYYQKLGEDWFGPQIKFEKINLD